MIRTNVQDRVGTVTIDRPPVNALSDEMYEQLIEAFEGMSANQEVGAVILGSTGTRAFCAGTDINFFSLRHTDDPGWHERHSRLVRDAFMAIYRCEVPVIAAVQSVSVGAGIGLLASCDVVIAGSSASFGLPEIDRGVLGGARHLRRMVSEGTMRYMAFTGERVSAEEFRLQGGAYKVVADEDLDTEAMATAANIASKSPVAVRALKRGLNHIELCDLDLVEGYRYEQGLTGSIANHPYSQEAANAFFEKRKPVFA